MHIIRVFESSPSGKSLQPTDLTTSSMLAQRDGFFRTASLQGKHCATSRIRELALCPVRYTRCRAKITLLPAVWQRLGRFRKPRNACRPAETPRRGHLVFVIADAKYSASPLLE